MSQLRLKLKNAFARIPYPLARSLVHVPFSLRLGAAYTLAVRRADEFTRASDAENEAFVLNRLQAIVSFAYAHTAFYRHWYDKHHFDPERLRSLAHFQDVPIVTKQDFRAFSLESRSGNTQGALHLNTGGTSGEPLDFYVDREAFAREWAHMHAIWSAAGYVQTDLKLTFRGKHLGDDAIRYNVVHNEYIVNAYVSLGAVAASLRQLPPGRFIRWLHGYPSLVAEFVDFLRKQDALLLSRLRQDLKGVLLGSEFPAPHYRRVIEEYLSPNIVSWYGHSEMAILAKEVDQGYYSPLQTYGYAEAVCRNDGYHHLVGTSYWNRACPFIRYDTGDLIHADSAKAILSRFQIAEGRVGDFVERADGSRIGLTALIFGRHHPAFDLVKHVQVRQDLPGQITIVIVPRTGVRNDHEKIEAGFILNDVGLRIRFEFVSQPVRTVRGKTPLLIADRMNQ
jgi:phenylacetate-CoA ligase